MCTYIIYGSHSKIIKRVISGCLLSRMAFGVTILSFSNTTYAALSKKLQNQQQQQYSYIYIYIIHTSAAKKKNYEKKNFLHAKLKHICNIFLFQINNQEETRNNGRKRQIYSQRRQQINVKRQTCVEKSSTEQQRQNNFVSSSDVGDLKVLPLECRKPRNCHGESN